MAPVEFGATQCSVALVHGFGAIVRRENCGKEQRVGSEIHVSDNRHGSHAQSEDVEGPVLGWGVRGQGNLQKWFSWSVDVSQHLPKK